MNIKIPELKHHPEDIEKLSEFFFNVSSRDHNKPMIKNQKEAIKELKNCTWPGNVRQLKNYIESLTVLADDGIIDIDSFRRDIKEKVKKDEVSRDETLDSLINKTTSNRVMEVLKKNKGNVTKSAKHLGISRMSLYNIMKKNDIPRKKG